MPNCWIIAGPNGAGKTTFALDYLPRIVNCRYFVNADLIASGLSPFAPEHERVTAGKLFIREIQRYISQQDNFAFETTLAGRGYLKLIKQLQGSGWFIELIYLALPSIEMAKLRVTERVAHGGHSIPDVDIERRFPRSLKNLLTHYSALVDSTLCFMNSGDTPELIFEQQGNQRKIVHNEFFQTLLAGATQ